MMGGKQIWFLENLFTRNYYHLRKYLIEHEQKIDFLNSSNGLFIHKICQDGEISALFFLIHEGTDINILNPHGESPLCISAKLGRFLFCSVLINYGAKINTPEEFCSALHRAAEGGYLSICELLISHGAQINAQTHHGFYTPLHLALTRKQNTFSIFRLLLKSGADLSVRDFGGETSLQIGQFFQEEKMMNRIYKYSKSLSPDRLDEILIYPEAKRRKLSLPFSVLETEANSYKFQ